MGRHSRSRSRSRERHKHKSSSSRRRSRSRSPGRKKDRDRSRSRDRRSSRGSREDPAAAEAQAQALALLQQQQLQKQLLQQQLLLQQQAMSGSSAMMSNKKQREVYVGNLTIGVVNDVMLRDLFNGALSHLVADPHINPPVVSTSMDPSGRFGFVELRTEELAQAAMQLDKVELCGRSINVGRPKGYVEPPPGARPVAALGAAQTSTADCEQAFAAKLGTIPTTVLRLDNMVKATTLLDAQEYAELVEDVQEEAKRYGAMQSVYVPRPPPTVTPDEPARVFIRYSQPSESEAAKKVFDGRTFDGNRISARYVSEDDLKQAETGIWNQAANGSLPPPPGMTGFSPLAGVTLPGMPTAFPNVMVPGMPAQQPPAAYPGAYAAAAQQAVPAPYAAQPPVAASVPAGVNEGWVKLRGVSFTASKQDFMVFFQECAMLREDQIKLVMGPDNRPTGEAFVEIAGPGANVALALAKDRQVMPNSSRYVEIFSSTRDELDRLAQTGAILV